MAQHPTLKTRDVITEMLDQASVPVKQKLASNLQNIIRTVQKKKEIATCDFPEPDALANIDIEALKRLATSDGSALLFYDSGPTDLKRLIVFATNSSIEALEQCNVIAADGTFDVIF